METIDAFGLQCPKPLVLAKKKIDAGQRELAVKVDNQTAVNNLVRLGDKTGIPVAAETIDGGWLVTFTGDADAAQSASATGPAGDGGGARRPEHAADPASASCTLGQGCGYAVFVNHDAIGAGDAELGRSLMKMALYTLAEAGDPPSSLLFMNAGVRLVAGGEQQVADSVASLIEQGTEVLVCGTCLDFYGVKDALAVGEVSNMYDILGRMREAAKVISL